MARAFVAASSQYLNYAGAIANSPPLSIAGWVYPTDNANENTFFCIGNNGNGVPFIICAVSGSVGGDPFRFLVRDDSSNLQFATTSTGYSLNTWHHFTGVWASATSTAVYIDGGSKGTDTDPSLGTLTLNRTVIGARQTNGLSQYFDGNIGEVTLWNAALTDDDAAELATGVRPTRVKPQSLVPYWPLMGLLSPEPDILANKYNMTLNAAPTFADHPNIAYGFNPQYPRPVAADPLTINFAYDNETNWADGVRIYNP
jgi:hypothetical protein